MYVGSNPTPDSVKFVISNIEKPGIFVYFLYLRGIRREKSGLICNSQDGRVV